MPVFDREIARAYDGWLRSSVGYFIEKREKKLIIDLLMPKDGESLLNIGCKTGNNLLLFKRWGCDVTGFETSPYMLEIAREKLGSAADLRLGNVEDLPFSDNEFDIVAITSSLEFANNPQKAISEAIRVCKGRIFLGVLNKYSLASTQRKNGKIFHSADDPAHFFSIFELIHIVKTTLSDVSITWGSVTFFPLEWWYSLAIFFEDNIPVMKNPFGSFIGLTFPVVFTHRTIQEPLIKPLKLETPGGNTICRGK